MRWYKIAAPKNISLFIPYTGKEAQWTDEKFIPVDNILWQGKEAWDNLLKQP